LEESATFLTGLYRTQRHCEFRARHPPFPGKPDRGADYAAFRLFPSAAEPDRVGPGYRRTGHRHSHLHCRPLLVALPRLDRGGPDPPPGPGYATVLLSKSWTMVSLSSTR